MNYGLILAGGVGQRMRSSGLPKQFLGVFGKPIIVYTIERFENCEDIDTVIVACNASWIDHMNKLIEMYRLKKVQAVIPGGRDRTESILNGIKYIQQHETNDNDVILIHDGVRPLVQESILSENIRVAIKFGSAMTVSPVIETVIISNNDKVGFDAFKKREDTYSLTSPQAFRLDILIKAYEHITDKNSAIPLLDAAMVYTYLGNDIHIVKEQNNNIKITTPEDYYTLRAILELQENKSVFGI